MLLFFIIAALWIAPLFWLYRAADAAILAAEAFTYQHRDAESVPSHADPKLSGPDRGRRHSGALIDQSFDSERVEVSAASPLFPEGSHLPAVSETR